MSKPYIISYDLNDPGQRYNDVKETIEDFSIASRELQRSVWLIRSESSPDDITDALHKVMDENDSLFVCELKNNRQGLASKKDWEFIRESLFTD
ncbi:hypothetical protein [Liquorilactobacillus aquaticus]|uniref:hypothetical protein n=1 Tax=Liquorilactobacillus aquaticus TaxID=392566 RepID=UPI000710786A|nr:hypothetical protein [Liquorilactobacillus aquaticus]